MLAFRLGRCALRANLVALPAAMALLAACTANVRTTPTEVAIPAVPTYARFGIAASVKLPAGTPLVLSTVDARKAYCSNSPVYYNIGESRGGCFMDNTGTGYFDEFYVLGTLPSSTIDGIHIPYSIVSMAAYNSRLMPGYIPPTTVVHDTGPTVMDVVSAAIDVGGIVAGVHNANTIAKALRN